jgi:hypothetical protein
MADSIIQPDTDHIGLPTTTNNDITSTAEGLTNQEAQAGAKEVQQQVEPSDVSDVSNTHPSQALIIWTPRFIVAFALVLVIGLSLLSVLTQAWLNGDFNGFWVSFIQEVVLLAEWIALSIITRSIWVRLGSIFGCIWNVFSLLNLTSGFLHVWHYTLEITLLNAISYSALLDASICLSLDHTPFRRWDKWIFRLIVPLGILLVTIPYILAPALNHSVDLLASETAGAAIILSLLVWWLRPSCWKSQPCPTFLYGFVPLLLLFLTIPKAVNSGGSGGDFFYSNLVYLCLILALMRSLQAALQRRQERRELQLSRDTIIE